MRDAVKLSRAAHFSIQTSIINAEWWTIDIGLLVPGLERRSAILALLSVLGS